MVRINFKEMNAETSVDSFETIDLRKELGNILFKKATDIPLFDLSRKIYHSEGEMEVEDALFAAILEILSEIKSAIYIQRILMDNAKKEKEDANDQA